MKSIWEKSEIDKKFKNFRKSSETDSFPYSYISRNSYIEVFTSGEIQPVQRFVADRREAFSRAKKMESVIIVGWTGEWRTDMFYIDNPEKLDLK